MRRLKNGSGDSCSGQAISIVRRDNKDPEVQLEVKRLLELKALFSMAEDELGNAQAYAAIQERQATSSRRASLYEVFSEPDVESYEPRSSAAFDDMHLHTSPLHDVIEFGSSMSSEEEGTDEAAIWNDGKSLQMAATWQLPVEPVFFEADRTTIKDMAAEAVKYFQPITRW